MGISQEYSYIKYSNANLEVRIKEKPAPKKIEKWYDTVLVIFIILSLISIPFIVYYGLMYVDSPGLAYLITGICMLVAFITFLGYLIKNTNSGGNGGSDSNDDYMNIITTHNIMSNSYNSTDW